ncbi:YihY/virulence factor BrkB family protein [Microcoleus sp. FACHB-831]|uniref:YihY/virulence factor BrkB family protein n=1 Tax=Microcoleus sp. FACHB-831 TaxID=2692827 RepID=UPI0016829D15|nr:YihY/virulence factor BrkB family protein [Microcoleus sp. FACHB-831]MBD1920908.1 YihY/virulence factor BrkB family protein [Microcoleus sp. FACHB-831]
MTQAPPRRKQSVSLTPKVIFGLLKETFKEWQEDKASRLAAALAYYTTFSLAPLLIIAIAIASLVFGQEAAQGTIDDQLRGLIGSEGATAIQDMIKNSQKPAEGTIATIISFVLLFFGASGVFAELQDSLNTIWEVAPKPDAGVKNILRSRFLSFTMVLVIGFLLLVSLVLSAGLAALGNYFGNLVPNLAILWQTLNFLISFGVITVLFAMIYRILPDAKIAWGDVWIGAAITSLLFSIGKWLIGLYLGNSSVGSTYGAAGSFVVLLLWVNYSAQILFFGAEFTQVYANKFGSQIVPDKNAVFVTKETRAQQGIPHKQDLNDAVAESDNASNNIQQRENKRKSPHPAAVALSAIVGAYRGVTQMGKGKGKKKNR